ncbi:MAG: hypothetical protein C0404_07205 [Verrucomicrobia bacterium]|nr:hypothetical protein [Verrucomicrobiota bacterium]
MAEQGQEKSGEVPRHVAVIMDGNGRWAKARGLSRIRGHEEGAKSVRVAINACKKAGVKYLTLYAFSVENWVRPKMEVSALMMLLKRFLRDQEYELHENKVRLRAIGRIEDLPPDVQDELCRVIKATEHHDEGTLILALSYGGRTEILNAIRQIVKRAKNGELSADDVDEDLVRSHLYAPDIPDPDLLIRTSGEMRISNFLLWQISYTELYITDVMWPDFREADLMKAIAEYGRRHRRFGDIE